MKTWLGSATPAKRQLTVLCGKETVLQAAKKEVGGIQKQRNRCVGMTAVMARILITASGIVTIKVIGFTLTGGLSANRF